MQIYIYSYCLYICRYMYIAIVFLTPEMDLNILHLAFLMTSLGILVSHTNPRRRNSGATYKWMWMFGSSVTFVSPHNPFQLCFWLWSGYWRNPGRSYSFYGDNWLLHPQYSVLSSSVQTVAHFQCYWSGFLKPFNIPIMQIQQLANFAIVRWFFFSL